MLKVPAFAVVAAAALVAGCHPKAPPAEPTNLTDQQMSDADNATQNDVDQCPRADKQDCK